MKKFLFTILTCFSVFLIAGCSDDSDDNKKAQVPEDLLGTYKVTFFGTQVLNPRDCNDSGTGGCAFVLGYADLLYVSNDCDKAKELYPDVINAENGMKNQCNPEGEIKGTANLLDGAVVIANKESKLGITSRVQLGGEAMDTFAPADKYQYTIYNPTNDFTNFEGKGVTGWNYDSENNAPSAQSTEFPESPYKLIKQDDGSIKIEMTLVGKQVNVMGMANMTVDAKTTVIMTKENADTTELENKIQKEF